MLTTPFLTVLPHNPLTSIGLVPKIVRRFMPPSSRRVMMIPNSFFVHGVVTSESTVSFVPLNEVKPVLRSFKILEKKHFEFYKLIYHYAFTNDLTLTDGFKKELLNSIGIKVDDKTDLRRIKLNQHEKKALNYKLSSIAQLGIFTKKFPQNFEQLKTVKNVSIGDLTFGTFLYKRIRSRDENFLNNRYTRGLFYFFLKPYDSLLIDELLDLKPLKRLQPKKIESPEVQNKQERSEDFQFTKKRFAIWLDSRGFTNKEKRQAIEDLTLAYEFHKEQKRGDGSLYFTHLVSVAVIVGNLRELLSGRGNSIDLVSSSLLHDCVEDAPDKVIKILSKKYPQKAASLKIITKTEINRIQATPEKDKLEFKIRLREDALKLLEVHRGKEVADRVRAVSKPLDKNLLTEYFIKFRKEDFDTLLIKIADRFHNLLTLEWMPYDKMLPKMRETYSFIFPLLDPSRVDPKYRNNIIGLRHKMDIIIFEKFSLWTFAFFRREMLQTQDPEIQYQFAGLATNFVSILNSYFSNVKQNFYPQHWEDSTLGRGITLALKGLNKLN